VTIRYVQMNAEQVELYKVLKFESLVHSGGLARHVIEEGEVCVNGEVEKRKRRKIVSGDLIEFDGHEIQMIGCKTVKPT